MKWVEWVEPFGPNAEPVYCRVPLETAIATAKATAAASREGFIYASDEAALEDFIVVHWGRIIDDAQ